MRLPTIMQQSSSTQKRKSCGARESGRGYSTWIKDVKKEMKEFVAS